MINPPPDDELGEWEAKGFSAAEMEEWLEQTLVMGPDEALAWKATSCGAGEAALWESVALVADAEDAKEWIDAGFDRPTAAAWAAEDFLPEEARSWRAAALTPSEARRLEDEGLEPEEVVERNTDQTGARPTPKRAVPGGRASSAPSHLAESNRARNLRIAAAVVLLAGLAIAVGQLFSHYSVGIGSSAEVAVCGSVYGELGNDHHLSLSDLENNPFPQAPVGTEATACHAGAVRYFHQAIAFAIGGLMAAGALLIWSFATVAQVMPANPQGRFGVSARRS